MNRKKLLNEIAGDVHYEMQTAIEDGYDWIRYEKEYGAALVLVEVREIPMSNGMVYDDVEVAIQHDDDDRRLSPLLEKAIREALPDWFEIKREVEGRQVA